MKDLRKILFSLGVILLGAFVLPVEKARAEEAEEQGVVFGYIPDSFSEPCPEPESGDIEFFAAGSPSLEAYYRTPNLPAIRNQNPYGTCWAFSSLACCEINLIKKGYYTADSIDLSELHLAYFGVFSATDPLGGLAGDTRGYDSNAKTDFLSHGGNFEMATNALSDWMGAVKESTLPYSAAKDAINYGKTDPAHYNSIAYSSVMHLKEFVKIPLNNRAQVKQAIKDYGAVGISYYHDNANTSSSRFYNNTYDCYHYSGTDGGVNHAVTIVGWDDDFPASNFKTAYNTAPSSNGAWIIRNSWGSNWGNEGYFYMSYECGRVSGYAVAFDAEPARSYEHNYQYDGTSFSSLISGIDRAVIMANVFTAKNPSGAEKLQGCSFEVELVNGKTADYTISVYTGVTDDDPKSGRQVSNEILGSKRTGTVSQSGMYRVDFAEPVSVAKDSKFSIVLTLTGGSLCVDRSSSDGSLRQFSMSLLGQTYQWNGSGWDDYGKDHNANLHLKAYTIDDKDTTVAATGIEISKTSLTLNVTTGQSEQLTAAVQPAEADDRLVSWSSSDSRIAKVDANGKVTAVGAGTAVITATAHANSAFTASCTVTCVIPVEAVKVTGPEIVYVKDRPVFSAKVTPDNATNLGVRWSSSNTGVLEIDSTGKAFAKVEGAVRVTAEAMDGSGVMGTLMVTVRPVIVTDVILDKEKELIEGDSARLAYTILPENATNQWLTWSSSDNSIVTVDENGIIKAKKEGTAKITAKAMDVSSKTGVCTVTVKSVKVTSVILDKKKLELDLAKEDETSGSLTPTVRPTNAKNIKLKWTSSDESVATVDDKGTVTGVGPGTAKITATSTDGSEKSATCEVTVNGIPVEKIFLSRTATTLAIGGTETLTVSVRPNNASNKAVKWKSTNEASVTVDDNGNIKGISEGSSTIWAEAADGSGINAFCSVTVKNVIASNGGSEEKKPEAPSGELNGWVRENNIQYWYEKGVKQGTEGRGKEIYDEKSDAWYWLDAVDGGKKTVSKDVYQESLAGDWGDSFNEDGERIGKWVRYDADGHMVKGWCAGRDEATTKLENPGEDITKPPFKAGGKDIYYFDTTFGTMAKGYATIDKKEYYFNKDTGILEGFVGDVPENGWKEIDGKFYWYENYIRQGYSVNPDFRGKEIYDEGSDAWYWLDNVQDGAKAVSKDVYQESLAGEWGEYIYENGAQIKDREKVDLADPAERYGKWVRYDAEGHMIKGWSAGSGTDAVKVDFAGGDISELFNKAGERDIYFFDDVYGTMAKGNVWIDGREYRFDEGNGILQR